MAGPVSRVPPHPVPSAAERALAEVRALGRRFAHDAAREALARAEAEGPSADAGGAWPVQLALVRSELLYFQSRAEDALVLSLQARTDAERLGQHALAAECAAAAALQWVHLGRYTECVAQALDALALAPAGNHPTRYRAFLALATTLQSAGDAERAIPIYRKAMTEARAAGDRRGVVASITRMAVQQAGDALWRDLHGFLDAERLKQAVVGLESGLQMLQPLETEPSPSTPLLLAMLVRRRGQAGDIERADVGLALWGALHADPARRLVKHMVAAERACCALALGDAVGARAHLGAAFEGLPDEVSDFERIDLACIHADRAAVLAALGDPRAPAEAARAAAVLAQVDDLRTASRRQLEAFAAAIEDWIAVE